MSNIYEFKDPLYEDFKEAKQLLQETLEKDFLYGDHCIMIIKSKESGELIITHNNVPLVELFGIISLTDKEFWERFK